MKNDHKLNVLSTLMVKLPFIILVCFSLMIFISTHSCELPDDNGAEEMDTTSHNFLWEIDTLGTSGTLRDVFAISDDDVWVVGEIKTVDSTYNAAHWDGSEWRLYNILW